MMYHQKITDEFDVNILITFLAEHLASGTRVLLVSETAEKTLQLFVDAWSYQQIKSSKRRGSESTDTHTSIMANVISSLQHAGQTYHESEMEKDILVAHPEQLQGQVWEDRHILVCCDDKSLEKCLELIPVAHADFKLLVQCSHGNESLNVLLEKLKIKHSVHVQKDLQIILCSQDQRCQRLGIDLDQVVTDDIVDVEQLGALFRLHGSSLYEDFLNTQKYIASLNIVSGRKKAHWLFRDRRLHNIKTVSAHLVRDLDGVDWQLYDDHNNQKWLKHTLEM